MKNIPRILCLLLCLWMPSAFAWEIPSMAKYGAAYAGPELLYVYVAHNQADDHAVIKISGINHELDEQVFWAEVRYQAGHPERVSYVVRTDDKEQPLFYVDGREGTLTLPAWRGQAQVDIKLYYDRPESTTVRPDHLATDYENQLKQK
ncbi:hypothetical protein AGMMS49545_10230 [Betaproteobacteria bacterium]|nr:hypothetical protein AGMMS49545_10230 [Betaproteobacteria bacterium]GHU14192.1 hypothetical protein FACS189441_3280 [Betaproteobacteria bacterium]GHU44305.1 hypothetical protein AGMMS50289_12300 [Betaproteobacteria bacterium]